MGKIIGLDVGSVRVGVAIGDKDFKIAFPRCAIKREPDDFLLKELEKIIQNESIELVVVGIPLNEDNEETATSKKNREFGEKLSTQLHIPVYFVDEYGSSQEALTKIPLRKDRRKREQIDIIAAQTILQRYFEDTGPRGRN